MSALPARTPVSTALEADALDGSTSACSVEGKLFPSAPVFPRHGDEFRERAVALHAKGSPVAATGIHPWLRCTTDICPHVV